MTPTPEERAERALRLTETFGGHRVEERDRVAAEIRAAEQAGYERAVQRERESFKPMLINARREAFKEAAQMAQKFGQREHGYYTHVERSKLAATLRAKAEGK